MPSNTQSGHIVEFLSNTSTVIFSKKLNKGNTLKIRKLIKKEIFFHY